MYTMGIVKYLTPYLLCSCNDHTAIFELFKPFILFLYLFKTTLTLFYTFSFTATQLFRIRNNPSNSMKHLLRTSVRGS